jgi:hypothetical protein
MNERRQYAVIESVENINTGKFLVRVWIQEDEVKDNYDNDRLFVDVMLFCTNPDLTSS